MNYDGLHNIVNLFNNSYFNVISFTIALLGIALSIYFYKKSIRTKQPIYITRTINLIKQNVQKIETVEITYNKEPISNLSITKIALWNDGKETINHTDIAQNDGIKVKIHEDFQILDSEIIYSKNKANDFNIQIQNDFKSINLSFDYFDFEEGIVLLIYHTGINNSNISITGTVKSVKRIKRKDFSLQLLPSLPILTKSTSENSVITKPKLKKVVLKKIMGWSLILISILMFFIPFYTDRKVHTTMTSLNEKMIVSLIFLPYFYVGFRILKRKIPKGFDIFEDEF